MNQGLEKDMTNHELLELMMKVFEGFKDEIQKDIAGVKNDVLEVKSNLSEINQSVKKIERELEDKIDTLGHRTITLKKVIEEDLHTQVRW